MPEHPASTPGARADRRGRSRFRRRQGQPVFRRRRLYLKNYRSCTAAGEQYDPRKFTAAHRTLPFGTRLKVTDRKSGRSVEVVVNDRGPFTRGRVLDLSLAAAKELHMLGRGLARVTASVERQP